MVNENKFTGNYYHFVRYTSFEKLVEDNFVFELREECYDRKKIGDNLPKYSDYKYFLSLTRKYDFDWADIRITFDSQKLSQNFAIKPYHYFNYWKDRRDGNVVKDYRHPYYDGKYGGLNRNFDNQYEERLLSNKPKVNLISSIIQIDVLVPKKLMGFRKFEEWDYYKRELKDIGIDLNVVTEFKPVK